MIKRIEDLYLEISNLLTQNIDADENYTDPVDDYLMRTNPDEYALYKALEKILNKNINKEDN